MDLTSIGSVNSYLKNLGMQQKWQEKKNSGQFTADSRKSVSEWMEQQRQNAAENSNDNDKTLKAIHSKLELGTKLTPAEEQYLQQKDPLAYERLQSNKAAQKKFEEDLKKCRTKEDVQRLKQSQIASSLGYVRSIMNDSAIPKEKKLEIVSSEHQKMVGIEKSAEKFVRSGNYEKLPTEAEKSEAEKLIKEAEEAKMHPENTESSEVRAERNVPAAETEAAENNVAASENARSEIKPSEIDQAEKTVEAPEKAEAKKNEESDARKAVIEAETSPAVQKVRRAGKGYSVDSDSTNTANVVGVHIMETKA